jgi:hypothetical protein
MQGAAHISSGAGKTPKAALAPRYMVYADSLK